ncbi:hypothetical protein [Bradyrhizobium sp. F1.13.3]|uniref:hypothetical protein n=1 Tax=Bradyrhizobium sp. F1.13.3 TaxID=3156351 RepID=UPI003392799C
MWIDALRCSTSHSKNAHIKSANAFACSWSQLLPQIEAWIAYGPEPLVRKMKQVLCNGDVDEGGEDILMAKICREEQQPVLRIDT